MLSVRRDTVVVMTGKRTTWLLWSLTNGITFLVYAVVGKPLIYPPWSEKTARSEKTRLCKLLNHKIGAERRTHSANVSFFFY